MAEPTKIDILEKILKEEPELAVAKLGIILSDFQNLDSPSRLVRPMRAIIEKASGINSINLTPSFRRAIKNLAYKQAQLSNFPLFEYLKILNSLAAKGAE